MADPSHNPPSFAATIDEETKSKKIRFEAMANNEKEAIDRISNLHEPIVHHILSFLPTKDATRSSTLSKKWKSIWVSYPIIDFDQSLFEKTIDRDVFFLEQGEEFLDYVEDCIQRRNRKVSIQKFRLQVHQLQFGMEDRVEAAIEFALANNVIELDLNISMFGNVFYILPSCLYSAKSPIVLKLKNMNIQLQKLLSFCTVVEDLRVTNCEFRDTKLSSPHLQKFELECSMGLTSLEINAVNLQSFRYNGKHGLHSFKFSACRFIRNLSLHYVTITNEWLKQHLSSLFLLEDLYLGDCIVPRMVRISHAKLRRLHLVECKMAEVEINTPNLISFNYLGEVISFGLLNSSSSLAATLSLPSVCTSREWFMKFRAFLGFFDHCRVLRLIFLCYKDLIFPDEIRYCVLSPLHDLKHMEIEVFSSKVEYVDLLDIVLWLSPHLETLLVVCREEKSKKEAKSMKFRFERIEKEDDYTLCCLEHPSGCWRHYLSKLFLQTSDVDDKIANSDKVRLLNYFTDRATNLEAIYENSKIFRVVQGKRLEEKV